MKWSMALLTTLSVFFLCNTMAASQSSDAAPVKAAEDLLKEPHYRIRGGLDHCRYRFSVEKQGRVVYLGGSITAQQGWRDHTCDLLKKWFPETAFDFINAGIGGTDSSLGAFRLADTVFHRGKVDLLFLEFAVNDHAGTAAKRAMEGIIRHARKLNPDIDILVQYFVDKGKLENIRTGVLPEVIRDHDSVVRYYNLPINNMALEMTRRIEAGEFTWEQFSKDSCHPTPFGHQLYADCIETLLKEAWSGAVPETMPAAWPMPEPLDSLNYENGRFLPLEAAEIVQGWRRVPDWKAEKTCNYSGAVDVLEATEPGAELKLPFTGTLIGYYGIAGMDAGVLEYTLDGGTPATLDLFDRYCAQFHRPVCHLLGSDLQPGEHVLTIRIHDSHKPESTGHACRILKFVAN